MSILTDPVKNGKKKELGINLPEAELAELRNKNRARKSTALKRQAVAMNAAEVVKRRLRSASVQLIDKSRQIMRRHQQRQSTYFRSHHSSRQTGASTTSSNVYVPSLSVTGNDYYSKNLFLIVMFEVVE